MSLKTNEVYYDFLLKEVEFLQTKYKLKETNIEEAVDIVVRWQMDNANKTTGFYTLLRTELVKMQKNLTSVQQDIQLHQRSSLV